MTITWKEILLSIIIVLASFCLGIWLGYTREKAEIDKKIEQYEELTRKDQEYIDSLMNEIENIDTVIIEVKEKELKIDTVRIHQVEKLRTLPLDSSVNLLRKNLEKYEHFLPR